VPESGAKKKGWLDIVKAAVGVGAAVAPIFVKNPQSRDIMNQSIQGAGLGLDIAEGLGIGTVRKKP
jgi:hypothetical protein